MTGVNIRLATTDDANMLRELGSRIFVDTFGEANTPANMQSYLASAFGLERVKSEIADASSIVLVCEVEGKPIGYARLHAGPAPAEVAARNPLELVRLYMDSAHHGSGVAGLMMERCIETALAGNHDVLWLGVWEHNPRAQTFYRKWGFERVGTQEFLLGDDRQTDWVMSRRI